MRRSRLQVAALFLTLATTGAAIGATERVGLTVDSDSESPIAVEVLVPASPAALYAAQLGPYPPQYVLDRWKGSGLGGAALTLEFRKRDLVHIVAEQEGSSPKEIRAYWQAEPLPRLPMRRATRSAVSLERKLARHDTDPSTRFVVFERPKDAPKTCSPEWRAQRSVYVRRARDLTSLSFDDETEVILFSAMTGAIRPNDDRFLDSAASVEPVRRSFRLERRDGAAPAFVVATWSALGIPIAVASVGQPVVVEAPPGEWSLTLLGPAGEVGRWKGEVLTPDRNDTVVVLEDREVTLDLDIVDSEGNQLSGVQSWLLDEPFWQGTATPKGTVRLTPLPAGQTIKLCVARRGLEAQLTSIAIPEDVDRYTARVVLPSPPETREPDQARLSGVLVSEESGQVIPAATLYAVRSEDARALGHILAGRLREVGRVASTTTDESGRFILGPVERDQEIVIVAASRNEAPAIVAETIPGAGTEADLGVLALPSSRSLTGVVRDENGHAIEGAFVATAIDLGSERWIGIRQAGAQAKTGADGTFELVGLPRGVPIRVYAEATGKEPTSIVLSDDDLSDHLKLELRAGMRIDGTVRSSTGEPVASARLLPKALVGASAGGPSAPGRPPERLAPTATDAEGRFHFRGLPCRPLTIQVVATGFEQRDVDLPVPDCQNAVSLEVILDPSITWRGVVRRSSGEAIPGALVVFEGGLVETSGSDGSFTLHVNRPGAFSGLVQLDSGLDLPFSVVLPDELEVIQDIVIQP